MAHMKDLAIHIEEYSCQDGRVEELLKWIINEHLQGRVKYEDLPNDAKCCFGLYEQEQQLMQDADEQAKEWEANYKADVHNRIKFAVENGTLDYDTGLELMNDWEKADKWAMEGIL
jgi:hypothetical protein